MPSCVHAMRTVTLAASLAMSLGSVLVAATSPVAAQVYRSIGPDGKVIYSDKPPPGARDTRVVDIPPPQPADNSGAAATRRADEQRQYEQMIQRGREQSAAFERARGEVTAAQAELDAAKKRLADGAEPLPGERMGTATGTSRLGDAYFERQQVLERAVKEAEARLEKAQQGYNQLR